ncbi:hypothetical protein [Microbacterium mangrovi]|uniref:hypothetical protein n=1 Tax=Microbacterium mangrovi TaxID=1348253 RepID=UPI000A5DD878|nr:hypothetical protein [Microbacterium mangrovi]
MTQEVAYPIATLTASATIQLAGRGRYVTASDELSPMTATAIQKVTGGAFVLMTGGR